MNITKENDLLTTVSMIIEFWNAFVTCYEDSLYHNC
jgi:hypothetical protein